MSTYKKILKQQETSLYINDSPRSELNKASSVIFHERKKTLWAIFPFLWMGFNCLKRQFTLYD